MWRAVRWFAAGVLYLIGDTISRSRWDAELAYRVYVWCMLRSVALSHGVKISYELSFEDS